MRGCALFTCNLLRRFVTLHLTKKLKVFLSFQNSLSLLQKGQEEGDYKRKRDKALQRREGNERSLLKGKKETPRSGRRKTLAEALQNPLAKERGVTEAPNFPCAPTYPKQPEPSRPLTAMHISQNKKPMH